MIEHLGEYPPVCIFPEGGTSNGKYLLAYKRGAFSGLRAVKPIVLKYSFGTLSPAWDVIPFLPLIIMQFSLFNFKVVIKELPIFVPNQYLFTTHANKGNESWEVYAWAMREIMSDVGPFEKNDQPYREKLHYEALLGFRKERPVANTNKTSAEKEPLLGGEIGNPAESNYGA